MGAESLCHLGKGPAGRGWAFGHAPGRSWPSWRWDDLRLVGFKLIFLVVSCGIAAGLVAAGVVVEGRRDLDAAASAGCCRARGPAARARLTWPDRALLALLAGTVPVERLAAMRRVVAPGTILRWHRDIVRCR